jgi:hypothetical protein
MQYKLIDGMTEIDLGQLIFEKIILHKVPTNSFKDSEALELSDVESPIDNEITNMFAKRLNDCLAKNYYEVEFDLESESCVPELVINSLKDPSSNFIDISREIARHLYKVQTGNISSGLLAVIQGSVSERRVLAILKLEEAEAIRAKPESLNWDEIAKLKKQHNLRSTTLEKLDQVLGKTTFKLERLRDIVLSDKTKIYKAAIFFISENNTKIVVGRVVDMQRGKSSKSKTNVASFFLDKFLGCKLLESASIATKNFVYGTLEFIELKVSDQEKKLKYNESLLAEINSNNISINPENFVDNNLEDEDKNDCIVFLAEKHNIAIKSDMIKDCSLIRMKDVEIKTLYFEGGLILKGPVKEFNNKVIIQDQKERSEESTVLIISKIISN